MYDFLDEITEIRTCCGFRENMIQVANKPFDVSRLELACLLISWMFHPRYHNCYSLCMQSGKITNFVTVQTEMRTLLRIS